VGAWRARLVRQAVQEGEQGRLFGRGDFQILDRLASFDEDQSLEHENREKGRGRAADEVTDHRIGRGICDTGPQTIRCPRKPTCEREVAGDKQQQAAGGQPRLAAVVGGWGG
jgi:hypothetical protein